MENGKLEFTDQVTVGGLPLPPEFGDQVLVGLLAEVKKVNAATPGIPRFGTTTGVGPNAVFRAKSGLLFNQGVHFVDADTPYVIFQTDGPLDFGSGVTAAPHEDFLAQFTTFDPARDIVVEDNPSFGSANFFNSEHFSKLPGTTILLGAQSLAGGAHSGKITVGANGPLDLRRQNFLVATQGLSRVSSNVTSKGFVGQLVLVGGVPQFVDASAVAVAEQLDKVFEVPIIDDIVLDDSVNSQEDAAGKDKDKDEYVQVEGAENGQSNELVTQQSNAGQLCQ